MVSTAADDKSVDIESLVKLDRVGGHRIVEGDAGSASYHQQVLVPVPVFNVGDMGNVGNRCREAVGHFQVEIPVAGNDIDGIVVIDAIEVAVMVFHVPHAGQPVHGDLLEQHAAGGIEDLDHVRQELAHVHVIPDLDGGTGVDAVGVEHACIVQPVGLVGFRCRSLGSLGCVGEEGFGPALSPGGLGSRLAAHDGRWQAPCQVHGAVVNDVGIDFLDRNASADRYDQDIDSIAFCRGFTVCVYRFDSVAMDAFFHIVVDVRRGTGIDEFGVHLHAVPVDIETLQGVLALDRGGPAEVHVGGFAILHRLEVTGLCMDLVFIQQDDIGNPGGILVGVTGNDTPVVRDGACAEQGSRGFDIQAVQFRQVIVQGEALAAVYVVEERFAGINVRRAGLVGSQHPSVFRNGKGKANGISQGRLDPPYFHALCCLVVKDYDGLVSIVPADDGSIVVGVVEAAVRIVRGPYEERSVIVQVPEYRGEVRVGERCRRTACDNAPVVGQAKCHRTVA